MSEETDNGGVVEKKIDPRLQKGGRPKGSRDRYPRKATLAERFGTAYQEHLRAKIDTEYHIKALDDFVKDKRVLTRDQINAAKILLDRTLPGLNSISISLETKGEVAVTSQAMLETFARAKEKALARAASMALPAPAVDAEYVEVEASEEPTTMSR